MWRQELLILGKPKIPEILSPVLLFKWDEPHVDNGGMFIQVSTNPVYDEFPEYITTYIATKLKEGEMTMGSSTPTVFKPFDAAGSSRCLFLFRI